MILICQYGYIHDRYLFIQGEWLCLNCQTQRALSGNLGDIGQIHRSLPTTGTKSAALPKAQSIKISEGGQATEISGPAVLKLTPEEQILASKVLPVESIEAADKTDELKCIPPEPTVREEKLTTEELIQHVSSQEAKILQIESETPPTESVITTHELKSEIVQPTVRTKDEPTQAMDSPNIMKPPTVEASFEFKEACELTSMVMYTKNVIVNTFLQNPFTNFTNIIIYELIQAFCFYR